MTVLDQGHGCTAHHQLPRVPQQLRAVIPGNALHCCTCSLSQLGDDMSYLMYALHKPSKCLLQVGAWQARLSKGRQAGMNPALHLHTLVTQPRAAHNRTTCITHRRHAACPLHHCAAAIAIASRATAPLPACRQLLSYLFGILAGVHGLNMLNLVIFDIDKHVQQRVAGWAA